MVGTRSAPPRGHPIVVIPCLRRPIAFARPVARALVIQIPKARARRAVADRSAAPQVGMEVPMGLRKGLLRVLPAMMLFATAAQAQPPGGRPEREGQQALRFRYMGPASAGRI